MSLHTIVLEGCRSDVLAHYLKAMGIFRLVAAQRDPSARALWRDGTFVLVTTLSETDLQDFFLSSYAPTPLVAPWNGGSGFYPKDNSEALEQLVASRAPRFEFYREVISLAQTAVGAAEQSPKDDEKRELIERARASWPASVLPWLDAALSLSNESVRYPALLGTGGNDGRLDFTNNFMQRLVGLIDVTTGGARAGSASLLASAVFGRPTHLLEGGLAIGQFLPGAAGGANSNSGFGGESLLNPWDFVLALEGAVAFQVAAVRRLDSSELVQASAPFAVRGTGAGYASASAADESARGEQWMPVWSSAATWPAFSRLLAEGRMISGRDQAGSALGAALALSRAGVARGITSFQRFGFIERNGQANLAVPLGTWSVRARPVAQLIETVEGWVGEYRRAAGQPGAPASASRLARRLQSAMLDVLSQPVVERVERLLILLSEAEDGLVRSSRWSAEQRLRPMPMIDESAVAKWIPHDEPIWEIARALSALCTRGRGLRWNVLPLSEKRPDSFETGANGLLLGPELVWHSEELIDSLCAVGTRRLLHTGVSAWPFDPSRFTVRLENIQTFLDGGFDDRRLARLTRALMSIEWEAHDVPPSTLTHSVATYSLCRLAWSEVPLADSKPDGTVFLALTRGRGAEAMHAALRRLAAAGFRPRVSARTHVISAGSLSARRVAAALLMPVSRRDLDHLQKSLRRHSDLQTVV